MALIGNYSVLNKSPQRWLAGSTTSVEGQVRSAFNKSGAMRNRLYPDMASTANTLYGVPQGTYLGYSWFIPQKSGNIASINNAIISFAPVANGTMGLPATGSATMSFNFAPADGQLIVSGFGSATMTFSASADVIAALYGAGNTTITFSPTASLIANGWAVGNGAFSINATMTSYGVGNMIGSTLTGGTLTEASIIAAMNASPPAVNVKKVNDVTVNGIGTVGNPWGP